MRQIENDTKVFPSQQLHLQAQLSKFEILYHKNLFITVMSELLTKGCVSFCCSHPSSSPRFIAKLFEEGVGWSRLYKVQSVLPFRKKNPRH